MIDSFISTFMVPVIFICPSFFCYKMLGFRQGGLKLHLIIVFLIYIWEIMITYYLSDLPIGRLLPFLYLLIFPMIIFEGSRKRKITINILYLIVYCIADMLNNVFLIPLIVPFLHTYYPNMNTELHTVLIIFPSIIILFYLLSFIIILNEKGKTILPTRYWISSISSFIIVGAMAFILLQLNVYLRNILEDFILAIIACLLLLFWFIIYLMFYYIGRFSYKENEAQMLSYQNEMIEKFVLQKHESEEMLPILSHDLKHHLQLWQVQATEAGNMQTVKDIAAYSAILMKHELVDVRHNIANAIINQKKMECLRHHIQFTVKGQFDSDLIVNKTDLLALLCNLLDNAIEAALQVNEKTLRKVSLSIKRKDHFLLFEIENSYQIEPVMKNNVFISSKPDRRMHGIGMLSIKRVVKNYNGASSFLFENGIFTASIMLCAYSNTLSPDYSDEK